MFDGRRGRDAITVFIGRFGCAQTLSIRLQLDAFESLPILVA